MLKQACLDLVEKVQHHEEEDFAICVHPALERGLRVWHMRQIPLYPPHADR